LARDYERPAANPCYAGIRSISEELAEEQLKVAARRAGAALAATDWGTALWRITGIPAVHQ